MAREVNWRLWPFLSDVSLQSTQNLLDAPRWILFFHHKFTQFFTQRVSVVSQQAHFGVVRCGPTCLPTRCRFSGPSSLLSWCLWLKSFNQFLEVVITTKEVRALVHREIKRMLPSLHSENSLLERVPSYVDAVPVHAYRTGDTRFPV